MTGEMTSGRARAAKLSDRYELDEGRVFVTGVQALVRVLLDQHRADTRAGLSNQTFVSGYQGSPLAGFDRELNRLGALAAAHNLTLQPAVNEELGATAVWGSQLANTLPGPRQDGVVGVWYGKAPGVDRASDAIRHGNYVGTDPRGGVLALCGDDPACKSSTIPGASESLLAALQVPVLVPGSVQEAVDLGRHAIACSRASGLWAALKVVTNVADACGTVEVGLDRVVPTMPVLEYQGAPYVHRPSAHLLAPQSLEMERTLVEVRLELAKRYAQLNDLNRIVHDGPGARLGVVAAGTTARDVRLALAELGLAGDAPVRVLQIGMLFPLDEETIRDFAVGLDEILVLEEKGPFLERLVRDALYSSSARPPVLGKQDETGHPLVPAHGVLEADTIMRIVAGRLLERTDLPAVRARLDQLDAAEARLLTTPASTRMPFFCSGCPHNSSTVADDDAIVGAGIGCHTMVLLSPERHGRLNGVTQMGGEGAQWIGVAPFVDVPHFVQNLGDGTFHHSGSLAIRAAVAANLNVTYKLLFNGYVAMTGGQPIEGAHGVVATTQGLAAEGVKRIVITTDDVSRYDRAELPPIVEVRDRREILATQRELAKVPGVTVLLHDQACAAELRRERKRKRAPNPPELVVINERVCEGCGDCAKKSGCLSVEPVDTEFGRKTRVNATSCNKDYTCLEGDCPSFLTVIEPVSPGGRADRAGLPAAPTAGPLRMPPTELPEPMPADATDVRVRLVGIGGTGVVTVSQVLGMAALLDGLHVTGLDQTGLSQKAGPVASDLRITAGPVDQGVGVPAGRVDVLLGFDVIGAATAKNLAGAHPDRTAAVISESLVPTSEMVMDVNATRPPTDQARAAIDASTRIPTIYLDAQRISEQLLGDTTPANVVVVGAALQRGLLPVSAASLEQAFRLNGAGVERNLAALAWGRAWVTDPAAVEAALNPTGAAVPISPAASTLVRRSVPGEGELQRLLEVRVSDLIAWGGEQVAARYVDAIASVRRVEHERVGDSTQLTQAVARGLHKLMAYKDEYEVARLHLDGLAQLEPGSRVAFHLHPPLLRSLGMKRKLKLGPWFIPVFRLLVRGRRLRGTKLDLFGYAPIRQLERALPDDYLELVNRALARLEPATLPVACEIAELPDLIRGYEEIKLAGVAQFRQRAGELVEQLEAVPEACDDARTTSSGFPVAVV